MGPTEIRQYAIAHEFGHMPVEPRDLFGDPIVIGLDDLANLLRIDPFGHRRRTHEIAKHDRERPALRGVARRRLRPPLRGPVFFFESRDGGAKDAPVTERESKSPQVFVAQVRERLKADIMVGEWLGVAAETETLEPLRNVDAHRFLHSPNREPISMDVRFPRAVVKELDEFEAGRRTLPAPSFNYPIHGRIWAPLSKGFASLRA